MKLRSLITLCLSAVCSIAAANAPAVGEWRVHPSYRSTTIVEDGGDKVYAVADGHLFSVTKQDKYIETYNKTDGFNGNTVSRIAYDSASGKLIIVYSNSNIDILDPDGTIHNIRDLFTKDIKADKSVNSIMLYGGNAYLSTNLGIVVINMQKYEVKDTYIIGDQGSVAPVYSMATDGTYFYALMGKSIKKAPVSGANLLDFSSWTESGISMPTEDITYTQFGFFSERMVIAGDKGDIYSFFDGSWNVIFGNCPECVPWIHINGDNLLCGSNTNILLKYDKYWGAEIFQDFKNNDAIYASDRYWVAADTEWLREFKQDICNNTYKPDGPHLSFSQRIRAFEDRVTVAPGFSRLDRGLREGAVMIYENGSWTSYTDQTSGARAISPDNFFYDVVSVVIDPSNPNHVFATTWGEGVYEFLDGKAVALHNSESTGGVLKSTRNYGEHFVRADGLAYDKSGNLWVATSLQAPEGTYNPICYMSPDRVWHEATGFSPLETAELMQQILFHSGGLMFVVVTHSPTGVFVKGDNNSRFFRSFTDKDGNTITCTDIYDIAEDKNGTVWLGTDAGPVLFSGLNKIFDSSYRCTRIKIPRDDGTGLADYLLDGVPIRAVAVDGGNRKWIGTLNGVYVLSADGLVTEHHFTEDNSPLPANDITSIAVCGGTGSVFIGTGSGIVEYRDGVTEPVKKFDDDKIKVFPNPVTPDYTGLISITGLEAETVVKITDASGHLVFEDKSVGGTLNWDGKNHHGNYVSSGVYFFHLFNTDEDNNRSSAAKVLIIR